MTIPQRDQPFDSSAEVRCPSRPYWTELMEEFFCGWNAAVHFVYSYSVIVWKEQVYQNAGAVGVDLAFRVGNVRAAIVLLVVCLRSWQENQCLIWKAQSMER